MEMSEREREIDNYAHILRMCVCDSMYLISSHILSMNQTDSHVLNESDSYTSLAQEKAVWLEERKKMFKNIPICSRIIIICNKDREKERIYLYR